MRARIDSRELASAIEPLDFTNGDATQSVVQLVREVLGAENAVMYRPVPRDTHWDFQFCEWSGIYGADRRHALVSFVHGFATEGPGFGAYDPFIVQSAQRNELFSVDDLVALDPSYRATHDALYDALGVPEAEQLRVLLCDGPRLLAWVGAVQSEPFRPDQRAAFQVAIPALRERALLAHSLQLPAPQRMLEALLDQTAECAFVLRLDGHLEYVSRGAADLLDANHGVAQLRALQSAVQERRPCAGYRLTSLSTRGLPRYVLAIQEGRSQNIASAVARASQRWRLSSKLSLVLERLCEGDSNKEIAHRLRCAEVTVERHVTQLFRCSGARSRAELVARAYQL